MLHIRSRARALLLGLPLGLSSLITFSKAQTLSAQPWPPQDTTTTLSGQSFPANTTFRLEFLPPLPTAMGGGRLPDSATSDANGVFRIPLAVSAGLKVLAHLPNGAIVGLDLDRSSTSQTADAQSSAKDSATKDSVRNPAAQDPATKDSAVKDQSIPERTPQTAELPQTAETSPIDVATENRDIVARRAGRELWRIESKLFTLVGPIVTQPLVWVGEGSALVGRNRETGRIEQRVFLSGLISHLEESSGDLRVAVTHQIDSNTIEETFTVRDGAVLERITFPPSPMLLTSLEGVAREGVEFDPLRPADPGQAEQTIRSRLERDPSNPFLSLFLSAALDRQGRSNDALTAAREAMRAELPFWALVRIAVTLEALQQPALVDETLALASAAYARDGYDPAFAVNKKALLAWGDPLGTAKRLFREGNAVRASAWLAWLRDTMPRFSDHDAVYTEYANWLDNQGNPGEATVWRNFATELAAGSPARLGEQGYRALATAAVAGCIAALGAWLMLQVVLWLKYLPARTRELSRAGGLWLAWLRAPLFAFRHASAGYYSLTERLVSLVLLTLAVFALVTWTWNLRIIETLDRDELQMGTLGGAVFWAQIDAHGPLDGYIRGVAAQLDLDEATARSNYERALNVAGALNNLGVLETGHNEPAANEAYRQALALDPSLIAARYNLGLLPTGYRVLFHNAHRSNQPMLALPQESDFIEATVGNYISELARITSNPWNYLSELNIPVSSTMRLLIAVLTLIVVVWNVLMFFVPRPRTAHSTPRSFFYELGALVIPGSGLADEVWGILLLIPWSSALVALAFLLLGPSQLAPEVFNNMSLLGLTSANPLLHLENYRTAILWVLAVTYGLNTIGWAAEFIAVRRHLREKNRKAS